MTLTPPKLVKKAVSDDLQFTLRLSRRETAEKLGYQRRESFNNVMAKDAYFPYKLARQMSDMFGYSLEFLLKGEGDLRGLPSEIITYEGDHAGLFEKDLILKVEDIERHYGESEVADFATLVSAWLRLRDSANYSSQDCDALINMMRETYNRMMINSKLKAPFIGFHPAG